MPHCLHQNDFYINLVLAVWLKLFKLIKAELFPKRYWQGPRFQEAEEEGDYT